jgi:cellulose biosynthesis protein BcsQ
MDPKKATRIFAIGSGKGGVGKSTITVNIGICSAKQGLKTALIDMDPLSNLAVVLDLPRDKIDMMPDTLDSINFKNYRITAAPNLDLLFPRVKTRKGQVELLRTRVFETFYEQLVTEYDCIVLDLPAGIQNQENLYILPQIQHMVLVVNPEPTSHVSAGGYVRAALEVNPNLSFHIWHNRFDPSSSDPSFNNRDIAGNYNRFVPEELQILPTEQKQLNSCAWIPPDTALNLLYSDFDFQGIVLSKVYEISTLFLELWTKEPKSMDFPGLPLLFRRAIRYALMYTGEKPSIEEVLEYLSGLLGASSLLESDSFVQLIERYRHRILHDPRRKRLFKIRQTLQRISEATFSTDRLITQLVHGVNELLGLMSDQVDSEMERHTASLLFFNVALMDLFSHNAVKSLLGKLIPYRIQGSTKTRNRNRQIRSLINNDPAIENALEEASKRLEPILEKKLLVLAKKEALGSFIFTKEEQGKKVVHHQVYGKLIRRVIHDCMYTGLGVTVGLYESPSSRGIEEGFEQLIKKIPPEFSKNNSGKH